MSARVFHPLETIFYKQHRRDTFFRYLPYLTPRTVP